MSHEDKLPKPTSDDASTQLTKKEEEEIKSISQGSDVNEEDLKTMWKCCKKHGLTPEHVTGKEAKFRLKNPHSVHEKLSKVEAFLNEGNYQEYDPHVADKSFVANGSYAICQMRKKGSGTSGTIMSHLLPGKAAAPKEAKTIQSNDKPTAAAPPIIASNLSGSDSGNSHFGDAEDAGAAKQQQEQEAATKTKGGWGWLSFLKKS